MCQKFFIEEFGEEEEQNTSLLEEMITKFKEFIDQAADGFMGNTEQFIEGNISKKSMLLKPKIIDMLIEMIQNEQLSRNFRIAEIVLTNIEKLTQSLYNGKKPQGKETPVPCLSEAS